MKDIPLSDYYYDVTVCGSFGTGDGFDYRSGISISADEMYEILKQVEETGDIPTDDEDLPREVYHRILNELDEEATDSYEYWYDDHYDEIEEEMKQRREEIEGSIPIDKEKDPEGFEEAFDEAYERIRDEVIDEMRSNWKFSDNFNLGFHMSDEMIDDITHLAMKAGIIEKDEDYEEDEDELDEEA